ncbi:MAG: NAD(P)/FAD-dependent oxidoreductase [Candidatus Schekmanbacteria bacterium]|nr:MAG: NAD(P)/FAD-dependent oxidoreductase [Candidatus Schekmanbacteria bacterium]
MVYDIAIIGGGPAGLVAGMESASKGAKAIIIEKRKNIEKITRCCCMHLILDEGYMGESVRYENDSFIFPKNGFSVPYKGIIKPVYDKFYVSPSGYKLRFRYPEKDKPIVLKFDKGALLKGLWKECEKVGVEMRNETVAYAAEDKGNEVEIKTVSRKRKDSIRSKKIIIADGVNSIIAESLGMNTERQFLTTAYSMIYEMEGVKKYVEASWIGHFGRKYFSNAPVFMGIGLRDGITEVVCDARCLNDFLTKSPLAYLFENAMIEKKTGCSIKVRTPMKKPFKGNAIAAGDSAAYVEVETQGAMMCGYKAAKAVLEELDGKNGFDEYKRWWLKEFEFNSDKFFRVAQGYALIPTYTDDEIDYLFSLVQDRVFPGTFSQYKTPELIWSAFLEYKDKIREERPELFEKIKNLDKMSLKDSF